jgi:hypothetical protein
LGVNFTALCYRRNKPIETTYYSGQSAYKRHLSLALFVYLAFGTGLLVLSGTKTNNWSDQFAAGVVEIRAKHAKIQHLTLDNRQLAKDNVSI